MGDMPVEDNLANNATAQTLNYALGNLGGRQKSWMQAAAPSPHSTSAELSVPPLPLIVRKRGRPRKQPVPPLPPPYTAHPTTEPRAETQPPSNSTSPQLANVVARLDNVDASASVVTVFPSPTPSEEPPDNALETPLVTSFEDEACRASLGSNRPSVDVGAQPWKQVRQAQPPALASTTDQAQPSLSPPAYSDAPRHTSTSQAYVGSPQLQQSHSRSPSSGQLSNGQMASPRLQQPQPQTLSGIPHSVPLANPSPVIAGFIHTPPFVNFQPTWYTRQECMRVLTAFQTSFSISPEQQRDGKRINVLKDATERHDWPYLIMHQLYCLLDFNPSLVPTEIRNKPGLDKAFGILNYVLDSNKTLSPAVLQFFSSYPYGLEVIQARWPSGFEDQVQKFMSFVVSSTNCDSLTLTCERRRYPPVTWELAHYLGLESMTFQRLLFTAILRRIWQGLPRNALKSQYEAQAVNLFQQNQVAYYQRVAQYQGGQYPKIGQVLNENTDDLRHWGFLLKQVVEGFEATLHQQGYSVSSAYSVISPYAQQSPAQAHQQQHAATEAEMASCNCRPVQPHSAQSAIRHIRGRGRPRTQAVHTSHVPPSQPQQHIQQQQQQQQRSLAPLLPPSGWVQPQQRQPNPARFGLHQAHLRSPILQARGATSPMYQYVQGYIRPPAQLTNAGIAIEKWSFILDAGLIKSLPKAASTVPGRADCRTINTQSKTVRVRCVKWPAAELPNEHGWAITDTCWIPYSYFTFNGTSLQQRKKVHHGKDLPIDITGFLKEGENVLEMTVMAHTNDTSYRDYLVAIEILGITSHSSMRQCCLEKCRMPAQQVLADIQRKLRRHYEDDDVAIVESSLTINLFDPFSSSKICDTPVRSKACLHNDCFDLDTFLETRKRKGDTSVPDLWRCPICKADARPHHLIIDGFLEEVKKVLDAQGLSKTRAIIVNQDGSWKPKVEVRDRNGVSDRSTSNEPPTPFVARVSTPAPVEVIDLSN